MTIAASIEAPPGGAESLADALERVYRALQAAAGAGVPGTEPSPADPATAQAGPEQARGWHPFEHLSRLFGLTPFERDVLVLCAGFDLERRFAAALGRDGAHRPTLALALTVLDDPHWSAVTPSGPLRHWRLTELGPGTLLDAPISLDERILEFVLGVPAVDARLQALTRPLPDPAGDAAERPDPVIAAGRRHWARFPMPTEPLLLIGRHRSACEQAFAAICRDLGLAPYVLDAADLPPDPVDRTQLARLWTRESLLSAAALCLRTDRCESAGPVAAWLDAVHGPLAVAITPGAAAERLDGLRLHLTPMTANERRTLWRRALGPLDGPTDADLNRISEYFDFDGRTIALAAAQVRDADPAAPDAWWRACREQGRRSLDALAQRIETHAVWEDLVLPAAQVQTLRQIAVHVRHRARVNDAWGFAGKHARGVGLSVLFAGPSGTGKTLAAEVLARDLELDLYRVDLASVVSKWIGETEKNLRAIFDAAAHSGAILLFDEADALFGKRSEVRDSHDRYANLEISYLLQQMEAYRGVAILTTNMQHALDGAFMRRIRFVVQFPFPDPAARADIWRRIFPSATPLAALDPDTLAHLNVAGGVIRNIALGAAFLAADGSGIVEPHHILAAARTEYAKLDKPLTPAEIRGLS